MTERTDDNVEEVVREIGPSWLRGTQEGEEMAIVRPDSNHSGLIDAFYPIDVDYTGPGRNTGPAVSNSDIDQIAMMIYEGGPDNSKF